MGNAHNQVNKPILIAGTAGGAIKSGKHLRFDQDHAADVFVAVLNALGVPATTFGLSGKRPLPGLLG